jgi:ABC-type iron transport system FetAB ATPase subunit
MTDESGTPAQQRKKRVRTDDVEATTFGNQQADNTAPSAAAKASILQAVASHPAPIKEFTLSVGKDYNALKSKVRQQQATLNKLSEPSFIPRSARVNFNLTAPDCVLENIHYKKHKADMEKSIATFQADCKKAIVGTAELVHLPDL